MGSSIAALGLTLTGMKDPSWMHDLGTVLAAVGTFITGLSARDNNVTSEDVGANKKD